MGANRVWMLAAALMLAGVITGAGAERYAVVVGITTYTERPLRFCAKDHAITGLELREYFNREFPTENRQIQHPQVEGEPAMLKRPVLEGGVSAGQAMMEELFK